MNAMLCPIASHARTTPLMPFIKFGDEIYTYEYCNAKTARITAGLESQAIAPGERIGIHATMSPDVICCILALFRHKAVPVLLSTRSTGLQINALLKQVACDACLLCDNIALTSDACRTIRISQLEHEPADAHPSQLQSPEINTEGSECILFTSGSTRRPRAVVHTFSTFMQSALGSNAFFAANSTDCWQLALPMYHAAGLAILFRMVLAGGSVGIVSLNEEPDRMQRMNITRTSLVLTQLKRILDSPEWLACFQSLRTILVGGGPLPDALVQRALDHELNIVPGYGSTEMASTITALPHEEVRHRIHQSGTALPGRDVSIAANGEVLVKGTTLCKGYYQNGSVSPCRDANGWFHTGDAGSLDKDGFLTLFGRKDLMFISGGENIYPEEIERALLSLPEIDMAIVVPVNDTEFGARPFAFVRIANSLLLSKEQIATALEPHLEHFKIPCQFSLFPAPASDTITKPDRRQLHKTAQQLHAGG
ncbi:MAG: o-succinylbenzoate--CoA ligase [Chitinivibrionales bacterium]|nr:o-succinylbenzoate--CoA ligase [Chitinivibrionales bacterium]